MIRRIQTLFIFAICIALVFVLPAASMSAAEDRGSIVLHFNYMSEGGEYGDPIPDVTFNLYFVASLDGGKYTFTEKFASYSINPDLLKRIDEAFITTLTGYVDADSIAPDASGVTDAEGALRFDDLAEGLYLITGSSLTVDKVTYNPTSFMVSIPYEGEYELEVEPKYTLDTEEDEPFELRVIKIWDDKDSPERPKNITVQLIEDGVVIDEVVLSAENNWRHTWTGLDSGKTYNVSEKDVPDDYTVTVERDETGFFITNKNDTPPPPTTTPPQTGQLWWPVPVLFGAGCLLLTIGIIVAAWRRKVDA